MTNKFHKKPRFFNFEQSLSYKLIMDMGINSNLSMNTRREGYKTLSQTTFFILFLAPTGTRAVPPFFQYTMGEKEAFDPPFSFMIMISMAPIDSTIIMGG